MSVKLTRTTALVFLTSALFIAIDVNAQVLRTTIGGVAVNPDGVLATGTLKSNKTAAEMMRRALRRVPDDFAEQTEMRLVSLRGLEAKLASAAESGEEVSDDVKYLAGLQQIQFVFVDQENNDIILAGPAEGWDVNDVGIVVGQSTGRPVILLDDLLVALRSVDQARTVGITCSIDPTAEGRRALDSYLKQQKRFHPRVKEGVVRALGDQKITVTGVPEDSHYARILVAADFRMKRYAMMLERPPIKGMPSFLELIKQKRRGLNNMMPRWWIACDYEPVRQSEDGLAWEIAGNGVKVMTEDEIISSAGSVQGSGKVNPVAQQWADTMTQRYADLAQADAIFGQLKNIMDLSLAAAIIERNDLRGLAGCKFETLYGQNGVAEVEKWPAAKTVASQSSFIKVGRQYVITASGGVQVDSWNWASKTAVDPALAARRDQVTQPAGQWAW